MLHMDHSANPINFKKKNGITSVIGSFSVDKVMQRISRVNEKSSLVGRKFVYFYILSFIFKGVTGVPFNA